MYTPDDRPLGSLTNDAYETLQDRIDPSEGLPIGDAYDLLDETGFSSDDAEYAVTKLLNRGFLYEVDGRLFVTEREDDSE